MSKRTRPPFRKFGKKTFKKPPPVTTEEKIKNFVIRNSRNGFFTKLTTLSYKFEIPEDEAWVISGSLLADNVLECVHDENGDAKLCEAEKSLEVLQKERQRRTQIKKKTNPPKSK